MKKEAVVLIFSCLLLTSCGSQTQVQPETSAVAETETVTAVTETETESGFHLSNDEYSYLSEKLSLPSYESSCGKALGQIGFTAITNLEYASVEFPDNGDINETVLVTDSNGKIVSLSCSYLSVIDTWVAVSIKDPDTGHSYWVPEGNEKYYDMYSYETGELVSKKSEDFSLDKVIDEADKQNQEASEEFDQALDSIAEEYGVEINH